MHHSRDVADGGGDGGGGRGGGRRGARGSRRWGRAYGNGPRDAIPLSEVTQVYAIGEGVIKRSTERAAREELRAHYGKRVDVPIQA